MIAGGSYCTQRQSLDKNLSKRNQIWKWRDTLNHSLEEEYHLTTCAFPLPAVILHSFCSWKPTWHLWLSQFCVAASVPAAGSRPQPDPVITMWLRAASRPRAHSTWAKLVSPQVFQKKQYFLGGGGVGECGEGRGWGEWNHDVVNSSPYNERSNGH